MPIKKYMPERRTETRLLCADVVQASWKDKSGKTRRATALLEDICPSGACLQLDSPVSLESRIRVRHPKGLLSGRVVYCVFRETGYFLGVRFESDQKWSVREFKPQHLLDVRKLVMRSATKAAGRAGDLPAQ